MAKLRQKAYQKRPLYSILQENIFLFFLFSNIFGSLVQIDYYRWYI
jgi:hypothetical protein